MKEVLRMSMRKDIYNLIVVVFFVAALIGAYILFKILESSGTIQRGDVQLGGALVGFVVIFYVLHRSYSKLREVKVTPRIILKFKSGDSEVDPRSIRLNGDKCTYNLYQDNEKVDDGKLVVTNANPSGHWTCDIPTEIPLKQGVNATLLLAETNGKKWRVGTFYLTTSEQDAELSEGASL